MALAERVCADFGFLDVRGHAQVGSCLAALRNLERAGHLSLPAGRGRQDGSHEAAAGRRQVCVYELLPPAAREGLDGRGWAGTEFVGAPPGDAQLVETAAALGEDPMSSFPTAARGSRAQVKAHSRFLDHPDAAKAFPEAILCPHRARSVWGIRAEPGLLCIQDGTDLNFAMRSGCEGYG